MSTTAGTRKKAAGKKKTMVVKVDKLPPAKKPRKPKGMPDFSPGETLVDLVKKQWRLGDLIGWGGFGALYYASPNVSENVDDKATYVAKVEPHSNGPLFGELAFYQRIAKEEMLKKWMASKKLKYLGVPPYTGSGSHEKAGKKFRFMIMERFGKDVDKIFSECSKCFHIETVLVLAIRIINILEYIHQQGYVHADIKGSNLMMGYTTTRKDQVFLVDYGLAYRFKPDGEHKEYKEDPKRRHDGTIEFTSRDAHKGVAPSCRTDLEILGYVMLQWLCSKLPWEDNLADKDYVMNSKIRYMDNIPQLLKDCLIGQKSDELEQYFKCVVELEYKEEPDYNKLRKIFEDGLRKRRFTDDGKTVKFTAGETVDLKPTEESTVEEESPELPADEDAGNVSAASPVKRGRKKADNLKPAKKPAVVTKKPAVVTKKPAVVTKKPAVVTKKPAVVTEKPAVVTEKLAVVTEKLAVVTEKLAVVTKKPAVVTEKPAVVTEKPAGVTKKPAATTETTSSIKRPSVNNEEKPAKRRRGRPKKFVDKATSP